MSLSTRVNRAFVTRPFDFTQRELDSVLGRFVGGNGSVPAARAALYAVDVREDADHLYIEAELPGFKKDEIDITLEDQLLTITAERKEETEHKGDWLLRERQITRFARSFTLPQTVSDQEVNAKLDNGELTITLNKREESKPRKIAVQ